MTLKARLESLKDAKHQNFISKLTPNIDKSRFLGIKNDVLRKIVKELSEKEKEGLLKQNSFDYIEEILVRRYIIEEINDYSLMLVHLQSYLPFIDNWVTCDGFKNKTINKNKKDFVHHVLKWVKSGNTYIARFAIGMLEKYYLDDDFNIQYLNIVSNVDTKNEYYLKMMVAWYFATALAKQYDSAIKILENKILDSWSHNKTIQKANESFRVNKEHKDYLKTLKIAKINNQY